MQNPQVITVADLLNTLDGHGVIVTGEDALVNKKLADFGLTLESTLVYEDYSPVEEIPA